MEPQYLLTIEDLRDYSTYPVFQRALKLRDAVVVDPASDEDSVRAIVQGTHPYEVRYELGLGHFSASCTCPHAQHGNFCKHMVATGMVMIGYEPPVVKNPGWIDEVVDLGRAVDEACSPWMNDEEPLPWDAIPQVVRLTKYLGSYDPTEPVDYLRKIEKTIGRMLFDSYDFSGRVYVTNRFSC
ncbi:MAG: hypothetical protein GX483_02450 [Actinomycetaceae bacterium]|nr:hypothetical protein [Actinomycetaceae bacterium]